MICSSLNLLRFIRIQLLRVGLYQKPVTFQGSTSARTNFNEARTGYEQQTTGGYLAARIFNVDADTGEIIYLAAQTANGIIGSAAAIKAVNTGGLGTNPFKGKTPNQIHKMFLDKGFQPRGPDPLGGKGGYVNPKTGRSYHIDPVTQQWKAGAEYPHVDVNRPKESNLPKRKYPLRNKLTDNE